AGKVARGLLKGELIVGEGEIHVGRLARSRSRAGASFETRPMGAPQDEERWTCHQRRCRPQTLLILRKREVPSRRTCRAAPKHQTLCQMLECRLLAVSNR